MKKVIVIPQQFYKGFVATFIKDFIDGLKKKGWKVMNSKDVKTHDISKDIKKATGLTNIDVLAFFILRNEIMEKWKNLKELKALKILIIEDDHQKGDVEPLKKVKKWGINAIFARYPVSTKKNVKGIKIYPLDHAATKDFKMPINWKKKKNAILLSGAIDEDVYPLRTLLDNTKNNLIKKRKHPGYKIKNFKNEAKSYAKDINKYKLALADCGFVKNGVYVVSKHYEIPYSGTALVTNNKCDKYLKKLGMQPGKHYISTTPKNLIKTVEKWLKPENEKKLLKITQEGQKIIAKKHTNQHRIDFFNETVEKLN